MARPVKPRWIGFDPPRVCFMPQPMTVQPANLTVLTVDELEAIRLADLEGFGQEEAARRMNVSRPTFGRIVGQGRAKVAEALVNARAIGIEGGVVQFHPPYGHAWGGGRGGPHGHRHGHGRKPWT